MKLLVYWLSIAIIIPLSYLPFTVLYFISDIFSWLLYHVIRYRRHVVYKNLRNAFPEKNEKEIIKIARQYYTNLADLVFEGIKFLTISKKEVEKRCTYTNPELLQRHHEKETIIVAIGHCGNWDMAGLSCDLMFKQPCISFYRKQSNPYFNKLIIKIRSRFGLKLIAEDESRQLIRLAKTPSIVLFPADQTPQKVKTAYWTKFLNQDTPFFKGTERMAKLLKAPAYFAELQRVKRGYYSATIHELSLDPKSEGDNEILANYVTNLEKAINKQPDNWLWSHKRWKHKRPTNLL